MLWDALVMLPDTVTFMWHLVGFIGLFLFGGAALGVVTIWVDKAQTVEVEEVVETSSLTDIQEWAAAHTWVEITLPGPAHRHGVWDIAPAREEVPGRRLRGAPQVIWGGASALSRMVEVEVADLFLGLRPQFQIRRDPSWMRI